MSVLPLQDKQDKNHLKGDFVFHTEHVVELVAKLLVQVESQNDLSAPVHVSDKYAQFVENFIVGDVHEKDTFLRDYLNGSKGGLSFALQEKW